MSNYFIIEIEKQLFSNNDLEAMENMAMEFYDCEGVEEYSMEEEEVDSALGEKAYCGGELPASVIETIESVSKNVGNVKFYFSKEEDANKFLKWIKKHIQDSDHLFVKKQDDEDWNEEWRKHYSRIEVSSDLTVVPSWELIEKKENEIYIYPGQGFGTGEHQTTFLCLKSLMENWEDQENKSCLDFGCGSGILGIAAKKKFGFDVDFCDIDSDALDNCKQNLLLNFSESKLTGSSIISRDRYKVSTKYSLVFANILKNVLISEKEVILSALDTNGLLIVSGILNEEVDDIVQAYTQSSQSLEIVKVESKGEWSAISFRRKA